jgi:hypothetical protein
VVSVKEGIQHTHGDCDLVPARCFIHITMHFDRGFLRVSSDLLPRMSEAEAAMSFELEDIAGSVRKLWSQPFEVDCLISP